MQRDQGTAVPEEPPRIEVTARDLGTGDSQTVVITDDYVITCAGSAYVHHVQAYANGTKRMRRVPIHLIAMMILPERFT